MSENARAGMHGARARRACCRENLFVSLAYSAVNAIAPGRLTYVLRNGMISAPEPGAVTTSTSLVSRRIV